MLRRQIKYNRQQTSEGNTKRYERDRKRERTDNSRIHLGEMFFVL